MSATTEIIARAVIREGARILVARERGKTWVFLPGGHVEPGEPVESALIRELAEVLGTASRIVGFAGVVEHGYSDRGTAHHEVDLIFDAELDGKRSARKTISNSIGSQSIRSTEPTCAQQL
ncbi:NUDIX domain-containing protein [Nocardia sp. NPDC050630]|uniref:NUDIX domain-containing protein n=1 Tax=Nocardia sp. NPDC050630 TaxID=3364321 RepID=UPI0037B3C321